MRAVRVHAYGGPEVLRVEEVADPAPGPGEVLVRVRAAGVNPVDAYFREGVKYRVASLPWTPGLDGAGEVEAVGAGVEDLAPGDRVWTAGSLTGTCAELCLCRADQVRPLPGGASFAQGAALGVPYTTAFRALTRKARLRKGEVLLVHGATGGVGLAAVQVARAVGAVVVGTGGTEEGRALVKAQGADFVLDHRAPGCLDEVERLAGRAPDVILEMLADVNLAEDLRVAARFGRIVVVGSRGSVTIEPRATMAKDLVVMGMSLFNAPPEELAVLHGEIVKGLEAGILRPVIRRELPLEEAPRAHAMVMEPGAMGKIVLVPGPGGADGA